MTRHDEDQDTSHCSDCDEINQCGCIDCKERRKLQDTARDALVPLRDISSPTSGAEHASYPGSDFNPIHDWLSVGATAPLLPHQPDHGKNSYDLWEPSQERQENPADSHLSNEINNVMKQEYLDWELRSTASQNDGNNKESRVRSKRTHQ